MKGTQKFLTTIVVETGRPPQDSGPHGPVNSNTDGNQAGLWMTPRANKITDSKSREDFTPTLMEQVKGWTTPTTDDAHNATRDSGQFQSLTRQAGKLNPHWVACLMGYPPLWAEIGKKFVKPAMQKRIRQSQTELASLKASATP